MTKQTTQPTRQASSFERFITMAERSDPTIFNTAMVIVIVICSALISLALWGMAIRWFGASPSEHWPLLSFALAGAVALVVATPAVIFGYLLVARVQVIRDDLRNALEQTRIANRAKTEFLANMSHEIRTPLNGVLGMAQILERSQLTPEQRDALHMISESGTLLMGIINDVLDLSKIESGQVSLDPRPQPLAKVIASTVELFRGRAMENEIELSFSAAPSVPDSAIYDSVRMRQCVANLVSNAVKFTKQGHVRVHLSAEEAEDDWTLRLEVRDTGIGIEQATLARLFQPFEQADASTSREYGGTGLGLALSRRLALMMGGDISVASEPGQGSCFTLSLRAGKISLIDDQPDQRAGGGWELGWLSEKTLLVVDDSRINRKVVQGLLKPLGPTCIEAENGEHALQILDHTPVDLVILDMHMPVMDGRRMLAELRSKPAPLGELPVIALTADLLSGQRKEFLQEGFHGFLTKPLRRAELENELARLRPILAR